ncbi:MAG: hypothetical protein EA374_03645 [Acholeplasmatales bacterium]|nr:MAG: hypothetical protein EA374_03645 [Acholeplasmatales bacterium]
MMKRLVSLMFSLIVVGSLLACRSDSRVRFDGVLDEFEAYWAERAIDFEALDGPLPLPSGSTLEPGAVIIWESLTPERLSDTGEIFPPAYQQAQARLRVTIRFEDRPRPIERTHLYTIIILPLEAAFEVTFISEITPWQTVLTVPSETVVTPPTPPLEDAFDLVGWYFEGTEIRADFSEPLPGPATFVAVWDDKRYDVTFDSRGGSFVAPFLDVIHSTTLEDVPEPTRPGYQFIGWIFNDMQGNEQLLVADRTLINQTIHAFALWIPNS